METRPSTGNDQLRMALDSFLEHHRNRVHATLRDVQRVLDVVHDAMFDPELNVGEVMRRCRIRDNNICTRFRLQTGMTIHAYISAQRTEAAKHLLASTPAEVFLIAWSVGYAHEESFCRAFRKNAGCTPSAWRSIARQRECQES